MKIAIISNLYPPHYLGGYEILCSQVCRELCKRGHEIVVLTSVHGVEKECTDQQDFFVYRKLELYIPFTKPAKLMRRQRRITSRINYNITAKFLHEQKPDIIFIWSQLRLTLGAALAAETSQVPVVYTFNDYHIGGYSASSFSLSPRKFIRFIVDNVFFRGITLKILALKHTTCISEVVKNTLLQKKVPIANSHVINQGIPIENFSYKGLRDISETPTLLYVGQLHEYKGVHTIIEALRLLKNTNIKLSIVGDGPQEYKEKLHKEAQGLNVDFLGKVPHDKVAQIYRDHDIFVFPSIWPEPYGLTHIEAMASGTIVVSTNDGGHGEFLEDESNAYVFEKDNPQHLADTIQKLLTNTEKTQTIIKNARQFVEERLTISAYVTQLEALLSNIYKGNTQ